MRKLIPWLILSCQYAFGNFVGANSVGWSIYDNLTADNTIAQGVIVKHSEIYHIEDSESAIKIGIDLSYLSSDEAYNPYGIYTNEKSAKMYGMGPLQGIERIRARCAASIGKIQDIHPSENYKGKMFAGIVFAGRMCRISNKFKLLDAFKTLYIDAFFSNDIELGGKINFMIMSEAGNFFSLDFNVLCDVYGKTSYSYTNGIGTTGIVFANHKKSPVVIGECCYAILRKNGCYVGLSVGFSFYAVEEKIMKKINGSSENEGSMDVMIADGYIQQVNDAKDYGANFSVRDVLDNFSSGLEKDISIIYVYTGK